MGSAAAPAVAYQHFVGGPPAAGAVYVFGMGCVSARTTGDIATNRAKAASCHDGIFDSRAAAPVCRSTGRANTAAAPASQGRRLFIRTGHTASP